MAVQFRSCEAVTSYLQKREAKREQNQIKKVECEGQNWQKVVSLAVASSCSYGDNIVKPLLLNKDAISKMGKRDLKRLK